MILAAGYGTRLRPLTHVRPKALCPIWGRPLLDRWIQQAAQEGFRQVLVNAHHMPEMMLDHLQSQTWPISVRVLVEKEILGTGGGIRNALTFVENEPLVVVNADVASRVSLQSLVERHRAQGASVTMLLCRTHRFDTVHVSADGTRVTGFGHQLDSIPPKTLFKEGSKRAGLWTFSGIQVLDPFAFRSIEPGKPFHIIDLYRDWIAEGSPPAAVCREDLWWLDVGSLEIYWKLHTEYSSFDGHDGGFLDIPAGGVRIHPSASVSPSARLDSAVVVGAFSVVKEYCMLRNTILWNECCVEPGSTLENCVVTDGVVVRGTHRNKILLPFSNPIDMGCLLNGLTPLSSGSRGK
ncbi:MAG: sugar phosphate nucleotidyltransferase [Desulfosoma sp.]